MPAGYRVFSWSVRVVRMLVVVAVAVLSGVVIGGVGIYLINDGSTEPPSAGANTRMAPILTSSARPPPVQMAAESATRTASAQDKPVGTGDLRPPSAPAPIPGPQSAATAQPQASPQALLDVSPPTAAADQKPATSDRDVTTRKTAFGKRRVAVTSRRRTTTGASGYAQSAAQGPVYDYSGRDISQRYGWRDDDRAAGRKRPRPAQSSFGGFFGDDRYSNR
jgi:hypothetical protein